MLKYNGIFINILLFTTTVTSQDTTILKHDNGRRTFNRINISLAEAAFDYNIKILNELLYDDSKIIDNKNIRSVISKTESDKKNNKKFFDFVTDGIEILMKYSDSDLEHFFFIFNDEIRKYHYRGCKFYELTENVNFRMLVARNLLLIKNKPALLLRRYLTVIHNEIEEAKLNINKRVLLDLVNELYSHDVLTKLDKILTNLDNYRMRNTDNVDLVEIIRSGIRSAIFDYYTELDHSARAKIKESIDEYLEYNIAIESLRIEINNTKANRNKQSQVTDKKHVKKQQKRFTLSDRNSDADDDVSDTALFVDIINKKIRQTELQTTTAAPKSPDVKPVDRETRIIHKKKQIERQEKQEYDTTKYSLISSYGSPNDTQIVFFDLPLLHNITELTTRPHEYETSQIFKYELYLNADRKNIKEPKLYLKKPEFQVNFPALYLGN